MDLFTNVFFEKENLLPNDGWVSYYGCICTPSDANSFFNRLFNEVNWVNDEVIIFGKKIITKRKVAWYGDKPFAYTYSKHTKLALPWNKTLLELKALAEEKTAETYNSCLLNLYQNGEEGMSWHSDDEKELLPNGAIASLSFGAERKFTFKHKETRENRSLLLEHGSLLLMKGTTQKNWLHRLPPTKKVHQPRINLTFRTIRS